MPQAEEMHLTNDKVVLMSVFDDHIQREELLTRDELKALLRTDNHLKKMLVKADKIKKACDFIRYKTNLVR